MHCPQLRKPLRLSVAKVPDWPVTPPQKKRVGKRPLPVPLLLLGLLLRLAHRLPHWLTPNAQRPLRSPAQIPSSSPVSWPLIRLTVGEPFDFVWRRLLAPLTRLLRLMPCRRFFAADKSLQKFLVTRAALRLAYLLLTIRLDNLLKVRKRLKPQGAPPTLRLLLTGPTRLCFTWFRLTRLASWVRLLVLLPFFHQALVVPPVRSWDQSEVKVKVEDTHLDGCNPTRAAINAGLIVGPSFSQRCSAFIRGASKPARRRISMVAGNSRVC